MRNHSLLRLCAVVLLIALLPACASVRNPLPLATSTENNVTVQLALERDANGGTWLAATFTPTDPNFHLYSKNLPREGLDGLGRPTLLELAAGSGLQALGGLEESAAPVLKSAPEGLLVYPAGPVTLRLPVQLPAGKGWFDEQVSVTYMACSDGACMPPVQGKLIAVRIPGEEEYKK
jgi:hypothetical protein